MSRAMSSLSYTVSCLLCTMSYTFGGVCVPRILIVCQVKRIVGHSGVSLHVVFMGRISSAKYICLCLLILHNQIVFSGISITWLVNVSVRMALQSGRPFSGETLLLPRVTQSLCARFTMTRFYFYYFRLCRVISIEQLSSKEEEKYSW